MSYQVLARKWRPAQFDDVVGQAHVVKALSNALDNDRVHHAFLFTGTRGVGKTTLARIFAKSLNCDLGVSANPCGKCSACIAVAEGRFIDLIEVDAASRTKVDDTRDLLDNVQYAPTQGRYKVYLIDEVHMLSTHSFNALLKTLEEPPEHVKFLLATTDPQKLPMTVLSRCIQFSLNAIEPAAIEQQLVKILDSEKISYEASALLLLARAADGSLRDALSLLDQAIAYCNQALSEQGVRDMLGLVDGQVIINLLDALVESDADKMMEGAQYLVLAAQDLKLALDDLMSFLHALALYQFAPDAIEWKGLKQTEVSRLSALFSAEALQLYYQIVLKGKQDFALAPDSRTGFEMVLLRLLAFKPGQPAQSAQPDKGSKSGNRSHQAAPASKSLAIPAAEVKVEPQAESQARPPVKIEETPEPFLQDGLQNAALQAHLTKADALKSAKPATQKETPVAEDNAPADRVEKPEQESADTAAQTPVIEDKTEDSVEDKTEIRTENGTVGGDISKFLVLIENAEAWSDFVGKIGLNGMARQLLVHMMPISLQKGVFELKLDPRYANLQSADRLAQIEQALKDKSGQQFKIQVTLEAVDTQKTAAGVVAQRDREDQAALRQSFKQDENVKELVSAFDASIDESSITVKQ